MKMMSRNDYMHTEGINNGEDFNIPTTDPSPNLLMTGPDADSSADAANGPSVRCLMLCGIFTFLPFFRSFELIW